MAAVIYVSLCQRFVTLLYDCSGYEGSIVYSGLYLQDSTSGLTAPKSLPIVNCEPSLRPSWFQGDVRSKHATHLVNSSLPRIDHACLGYSLRNCPVTCVLYPALSTWWDRRPGAQVGDAHLSPGLVINVMGTRIRSRARSYHQLST